KDSEIPRDWSVGLPTLASLPIGFPTVLWSNGKVRAATSGCVRPAQTDWQTNRMPISLLWGTFVGIFLAAAITASDAAELSGQVKSVPDADDMWHRTALNRDRATV